jgi:hypothetical protein
MPTAAIVQDSIHWRERLRQDWRNEKKMEQNGLPIKFDFNGDKEREERFMPLCLAVWNEFDLSSERIYVYAARTEEYEFTDARSLTYQGRFFRGIQISPEDMHNLPRHLQECVFRPNEELMYLEKTPTFMEMLAFENLVYIRNSTCVDSIGFVLTLAHELQHVTQRCKTRKILSANSLLYHNLVRTLDPQTTLTAIDIPSEQDANVVSKRIAEKIFGPELVRKYAEAQIKLFDDMSRNGDSDARSELIRWHFFLRYDSSVPYDLTARTIPIFEQYKPKIKPALAKKYDLDISQEKWWT